jgi:hypothetical protein
MNVNDILDMMNTLHKSDPGGTISMSPDETGRYTPTGLPTISGGGYINPQNQEPVFKGVFGKGSPSTGDVTTTLGNIAEALAPNSWGGRLGGAMARQVGQKEARTLWNTRAREYLNELKRKKGLLQTQRNLVPLMMSKALKPKPTESPAQYETRIGMSGIPESNMPTTGEGYAMLQDYLRKNPVKTTSMAEQNPAILSQIAEYGMIPGATPPDFSTSQNVSTPYGALPANVAYHYLQNLKPTDSTTKLVNSWSQALFGKGWAALTQPQKKAVMDKYGLQNPMAIRAVGPPYDNVIPTSEGLQPVNARTGRVAGGPIGEKPLSPSQITSEQQIGTLKETLNRVKNLYNPGWVGPIAGRWGGVKESTVGLTPEQARFYSDLAQMQNTLVYLMSGKQINEHEFERLKKQLPDRDLPPSTFKARMNTFEKTLNSIINQRRAASGGYGVPGTTRGIRRQGNDGNWYVNDGQGWRRE